jgi:hypothetical protein
MSELMVKGPSIAEPKRHTSTIVGQRAPQGLGAAAGGRQGLLEPPDAGLLLTREALEPVAAMG